MTQSYNLSQLANNLDTAGRLDATDGLVGAVPPANGGTGQASYTVGDILYASGATALAKLSDVATGNVLISGGVGAAPSYGKVGLTTHVSGTLPVANGGTGATTLTANGVLIGAGTSAVTSVAPGTSGNVLTSNGTAWVSTTPITFTGGTTTTGNTIFTISVPSTVKRVTLMLTGVQTASGNSIPMVRLGSSGGLTTTGYAGQAGGFAPVGATGVTTSSNGILLQNAYVSGNPLYGTIVCTSLGFSNYWLITGNLSNTGMTVSIVVAYGVTLSGAMTQISLSTASGADTFNSGTIGVAYE